MLTNIVKLAASDARPGPVQELQASPFAAASRAFCSPQLPPIKMSQDPSVPKPGSPRKRVSTLRSIVEVAPTSEGGFPASPGTPASTDKVCRWPPVLDPSQHPAEQYIRMRYLRGAG